MIKKCIICNNDFDAKGSQKTCSKICSKEHKLRNNRKLTKEWKVKNSERNLLANKIWKDNNREYCKIQAQKPEYKQRRMEYRRSDKYKERTNARHKERYNNDINYKMAHILRGLSSRIRVAGSIKNNTTIELLGCTFIEAKQYIEKLFLDGMTWKNNTKKGWHIDHIVPIASFDLTNPEEQKKCFHYTNLQPLWWKDNLNKGCKY